MRLGLSQLYGTHAPKKIHLKGFPVTILEVL